MFSAAKANERARARGQLSEPEMRREGLSESLVCVQCVACLFLWNACLKLQRIIGKEAGEVMRVAPSKQCTRL